MCRFKGLHDDNYSQFEELNLFWQFNCHHICAIVAKHVLSKAQHFNNSTFPLKAKFNKWVNTVECHNIPQFPSAEESQLLFNVVTLNSRTNDKAAALGSQFNMELEKSVFMKGGKWEKLIKSQIRRPPLSKPAYNTWSMTQIFTIPSHDSHPHPPELWQLFKQCFCQGTIAW